MTDKTRPTPALEHYAVGAYVVRTNEPGGWRENTWNKITIPGSCYKFLTPGDPDLHWYIGIIRRSESQTFYTLGDYDIMPLPKGYRLLEEIAPILKQLDHEATAAYLALLHDFTLTEDDEEALWLRKDNKLRDIVLAYKNIIRGTILISQ